MKIVSGKKYRARRILLYGLQGIGKSTFAAQAPKPIFLNIEDGLDRIECDKTEPLRTVQSVLEALEWLTTAQHNYYTVAIDTIDWLEQLMFAEICRKEGKESIGEVSYGKGYEKSIPTWKAILAYLDVLRERRGMSAILLAHSRMIKIDEPGTPSYNKYTPDLWVNSKNEGIGNMLQEWVDEVLFARYKTYTTKEGKGFHEKTIAVGGEERVVQTTHSANAYAKNRLGMPMEIPLSWNDYFAYMMAGKPQPQPTGNIAGVVVDGSSKKKEDSPELAEMQEFFGGSKS